MNAEYTELDMVIKALEAELEDSEKSCLMAKKTVDNALEVYLVANKQEKVELERLMKDVIEGQAEVERDISMAMEHIGKATKIKKDIEEYDGWQYEQ